MESANISHNDWPWSKIHVPVAGINIISYKVCYWRTSGQSRFANTASPPTHFTNLLWARSTSVTDLITNLSWPQSLFSPPPLQFVYLPLYQVDTVTAFEHPFPLLTYPFFEVLNTAFNSPSLIFALNRFVQSWIRPISNFLTISFTNNSSSQSPHFKFALRSELKGENITP